MKGFYLCGCSPKRVDFTASEDGQYDTRFKNIDAEGYKICPLHGQRMYGWRSPTVQHEAGHEVPDWRGMGSNKELALIPAFFDKRDNRDPVLIGTEILAKRNGG